MSRALGNKRHVKWTAPLAQREVRAPLRCGLIYFDSELGEEQAHANHQHVLRHSGAHVFRDNRRHSLPHIHVRYQGDEAVIAIEDGRLLDGIIPPKQLKLVQAWIEIHKEELHVDWDLAVNGDPPFRIAPLQ